MRLGGRVVQGHGVASGAAADPRFPGGTIALQRPHFAARGLDLSWAHPATLNIDVSPLRPTVIDAPITFGGVRWLDGYPPEDFSFVPGTIVVDLRRLRAIIYHPHPSTKPDHCQPRGVLEVLAPFIGVIETGMPVDLFVDERHLSV